VSLGREDIAALIPHRGAMCLLERVLEWDARHIVLATRTHAAPDNPLKLGGRLRAAASWPGDRGLARRG